jgi:hypothetical protein
MSTEPVFNSPELQKAFKESKQSLESLKANLDLISRDIRTLEEYLTATAIRVPIAVTFGDVEGLHGGSPGLRWEEDEKSSRWRLMYSEVWDDSDGDTHWEFRPLIEMPTAMRIALYPQLPLFLRHLAKEVRVAPLANRVVPEDNIDWDKLIEKEGAENVLDPSCLESYLQDKAAKTEKKRS